MWSVFPEPGYRRGRSWARLVWLAATAALAAALLAADGGVGRAEAGRDPFDPGWFDPAHPREERRPARPPADPEQAAPPEGPAPRRRPAAWPANPGSPPRPPDERITRLA